MHRFYQIRQHKSLDHEADNKRMENKEDFPQKINKKEPKNICRKSETKPPKKNLKIDLITDPSTSGIYLWGVAKPGHVDSLCSQTNLHKVSFLDNFQSSCYIRVVKNNISQCEDLKQTLFQLYVSFKLGMILSIAVSICFRIIVSY